MSQARKDVLNGWKEIAAYLGRDPRTVERWEKQRRLPVRRLPGGGRASVFALTSELDAWRAGELTRTEPVPSEPSSPDETLAEAATDLPASPASDGSTGAPEEPSASDLDEPLTFASPKPLTPEVVTTAPHSAWRLPALISCAFVLLLLAGWGGLRNRHVATPPSHKANPPVPVRTLVPSSRVPGVEDLYLEGSYDAELRTPDSLERAASSFSTAIARDPGFAPAYSGLASTYLLLREYSMLSDQEAYSRALLAADQALKLDPEFPQAHAVEGFVDFFWKWDPGTATREFEAAEQLEPTLPVAHHWYGSMLTHEGRFPEALHELQIAQKLDPSSPAILTMRAYAMGLSGQRAQGEGLLEEAIRTERPGQFRWPGTMHQVLSDLSLLSPRDTPRFLSEALIAAELRNDRQTVRLMRLGTEAYRTGGEKAMWRTLLAAESRRGVAHPASYATARYEAALGENEEALRALQGLYARHDAALIGISIDPLFAELQKDSRFGALRHAVGLPDRP